MRSIEIDIRFDGGKVRVKRATGVSERRNARDIEAMLRALWNRPEHRELVVEVARGRRNLLDLYIAFLSGRIDEVGPATEDREVQPLVDAWLLEFQASEKHKASYRQTFKQLLAQSRTAHLSDLPALLKSYRETCLRENHPRAFNYAKQGVLALIRDTIGRRSPLRDAVADVPSLVEAKEGVLGLSVDEARTLRIKLEALPNTTRAKEAARAWWALCCTGMNPKEFFVDGFTVLADRILIHGQKRRARRRFVPLITAITPPQLSQDQFAKLLHRVGGAPYQGRKTFARMMEDAQIPRARREIYRGHAARDIGDVYERYEVDAFLAEDRARLLKVLGSEPTLALIRTHGLVVGRTQMVGTESMTMFCPS